MRRTGKHNIYFVHLVCTFILFALIAWEWWFQTEKFERYVVDELTNTTPSPVIMGEQPLIAQPLDPGQVQGQTTTPPTSVQMIQSIQDLPVFPNIQQSDVVRLQCDYCVNETCKFYPTKSDNWNFCTRKAKKSPNLCGKKCT